tara:strand:- start:2046 stop:7133 length:5088 start_codon:yes stop_codon:yes gene_type:complete
MTTFRESQGFKNHRNGARFNKVLEFSESGLGNLVKDAAISSRYSDIFDGQLNFFPKLEVTRDSIPTNLDEGTVPIGTTPASTNYLLEFPTITPPQFGSADLDSVNLHLTISDLNYTNTRNLPDIEIYKFKRKLPEVGTFANLRLKEGSTTIPERVTVGSSTYDGGARLFENFTGGTSAGATDLPSLFTGGLGGIGEREYYATAREAWAMEEYVQNNDTDSIESSADDYEEYKDRYSVNWEGYGNVVRFVHPTLLDGGMSVMTTKKSSENSGALIPSTGQKIFQIDPRYMVYEFNADAARLYEKTSKYIGEYIRVKGDSINLASADETVHTTRSLKSAVVTTENSFFDRVQYTGFSEGDELDPRTGQKVLTAISIPHFSAEGGGSSGQTLRLLNTITKNDKTNKYSWGTPSDDRSADIAGYQGMCLMKRIPKPLKLARKEGFSDTSGGTRHGEDMNQMRVRIKFNIQHMTKSHRSGDMTSSAMTAAASGRETGANILRSMVVMFATRPPDVNGETLGLYLNRMNTGKVASSYSAYNGATYDHSGGTTADRKVVAFDGNQADDVVVGTTVRGVGIEDGQTVASVDAGNNEIVLSAVTTASATSGRVYISKDTAFNDVNNANAAGRMDGSFDQGSMYIAQDLFNEITRENIDAAGAERVNNYNGIALMNFAHGTADGATLDTGQSNAENEDGRMFMFHSGDDNSRRNYWDGYYQGDADYQDVGATDFLPIILKDSGVSHQRVGDTFTGAASGTNGPDSNYFTSLHDSSKQLGVIKNLWYYLDAYMNVDEGSITWVISDMNDVIIAKRKQLHSGGAIDAVTTADNDTYGFPTYMTLWVNNVRVGKNAKGASRGEIVDGTRGFFSEYQDSSVDIFIDSMSVEGFEPRVNNTTITPKNLNGGRMQITGDSSGLIPDLANAVAGDKMPEFSASEARLTTPSYFSWGATTDIWSSKTNYIFLGDFSCSNYNEIDATDDAKRMDITSSGLSDVRFFTYVDNAAGKLGMDAINFGNSRANQGPNLNDHVDTGVGHDDSSSPRDLMIDGFTKKGFLKVQNPTFSADGVNDTDTDGAFALRENPMFSTKILTFNSKGDITVANPEVLNGFEDDEYIIYRAGYAWDNDDTSAYYRSGLKIKHVQATGAIQLIKPTGTKDVKYSSDGTKLILHESHIHELYISPFKYWFMAEIYNHNKAARHILPDRSYGYSFICDDTRTPSTLKESLGLTFNETKYSDTINSSNQWRHLNSGKQNSLIERKVDYGFGTYKDAETLAMDNESGAGYIQKTVPILGENIIDLGGLVDIEKTRLLDSEESISLWIASSTESIGGSSIVSTKGLTASERPKLTYVYKDELPIITDFKIKPYEEDPFYPELTWECGAEDLWYGFVILDNENIDHQYHKGLHIPLNERESGRFEGNAYKTGYDSMSYNYTSNATTKGSSHYARSATNLTTSIEGLAGNCVQFDGDKVTQRTLKFTTTGERGISIVNQMSLVAHFTVDSLAKIDEQTNDKGYIFASTDSVALWVDKDGKINATLSTDDASTTITLKSTYTVPVGNNIPTNVILTGDSSLSTGNVKLFVNGILEDQSGNKTTAGSSKNWKIGQQIEDLHSFSYIGYDSTSNFFNGKIEEIVIYNTAIYPVDPKEGKVVIYKPIEELTTAESAAGKSVNYRLFVKDYHNIRGTTTEEVASTSPIGIRKSGLGLRTIG